MSIAIPQWLAPWLIGAGLVGVVLALIATIRAYVHLRRAGYYVVREEARRAVVRRSLLLLLFLLVTIGFVLIPRTTPVPRPTPTETPRPTPPVTPTGVLPTGTATTTPTPRATATEPFIPTSIPQATLPAAFASPLPSAIPPPADAHLEFWTLAQGVDPDDQPVTPTTEFPVGIERVYVFFRYDGLRPNVPWTTVWYRNAEPVSGGTRLWESERSMGQWYEYLEFAGGYPVGEYEVQIWLGQHLQIRAFFSVTSGEG